MGMATIKLVKDKPIPFHPDYIRDTTERAFYELSFVGGWGRLRAR